MVATAGEELVTLELDLVAVNKVLLEVEELDDDDTIDEVEDAELELLMLDTLELALLLLEDDDRPLLADKLEPDELEVAAWLRLLDAEMTSTRMQNLGLSSRESMK